MVWCSSLDLHEALDGMHLSHIEPYDNIRSQIKPSEKEPKVCICLMLLWSHIPVAQITRDRWSRQFSLFDFIAKSKGHRFDVYFTCKFLVCQVCLSDELFEIDADIAVFFSFA